MLLTAALFTQVQAEILRAPILSHGAPPVRILQSSSFFCSAASYGITVDAKSGEVKIIQMVGNGNHVAQSIINKLNLSLEKLNYFQSIEPICGRDYLTIRINGYSRVNYGEVIGVSMVWRGLTVEPVGR